MDRHPFDNLPIDFSELREVYERDIQPELEAQEKLRAAAAAKSRQYLIIGILAGLLVGGGGFLLFRNPIPIVIALVLAGGCYAFGAMDLNKIRKQAKQMLVKPVAEAMGLTYDETMGRPTIVHDFRSNRLLPSWDREDYEDNLRGVYHGVNFELFEAHLEQRRTTTDSKGRTRTSWVTVFRGQCLRFDFHKEFHGETLVLRDAGMFNSFSGKKGLKRARLEDPVFEKAFEVYTTDQVESRYLLTPDLMQRMVELEEGLRGKNLKCAFVEGEVLVTVEAGNLFEPGTMFEPIDNPERLHDLLADFAVVFNLIDKVTDLPDRPA